MKVLFVCEGNAMRSPMAAAFYNAMTGTNDAVSAGAAPFPIGGGAFPTVIEAMKEKGISLQDHRSQQVTSKMLADAELIVAFPTPLMPAFVQDSAKTQSWPVIDPHYAPQDGTDYVRLARDEIERMVADLVDARADQTIASA